MDYNYHTHTYRCHHAMGQEREYIEKAISGGIKYMGFSEHIPFRFPNGHESEHRLYISDVKDYFDTLKALRKEYSDKIEIVIGFETEFYPLYWREMIQNAIDYGAEYLILGHHYLGNELPDLITSRSKHEKYDELKEYVDSVIMGMETGYFTYVAHPDLLNFVGDDKLYDKEMRRICKKSTQLNIPLEINFLGIRTNRSYPNEKFWKIAGEENSPVTFGFDAHDVNAAFDEKSEIKAIELVKKCKLNYIGRPEIKKLNCS